MELSLAQIIGMLLKACILSTVFALGLKAAWADVASLLHRPGLLVRSLLAMYVLTPLAAVLLVLVLHAPRAVGIAVLLMAVSAGASALPKKLLKAGADLSYAYSLSVIAAVLAIATVPVSLAILGPLFRTTAGVPVGEVAYVIVTTCLAPVFAGMVVRHLWPVLADRVSDPIGAAAGIAMLGVGVLIVASNHSAILDVGLRGFVVIAVMTLAALAIGHALGGPDPNDRTALAVACSSRFPGLALLIASLNFPNAKPLPLVAAYLIASGLVAVPYLRWRKSQAQ
jgi:bile acid:Na+ symporter, BASS family